MTFEQQWIEYDYNPFLLFGAIIRVISLNAEAQFLLGSTDTETLFNLAAMNASVTFGFKTTFAELSFGRYNFFAFTVGYEDDAKIGIKLDQTPSFKVNRVKPTGELSNIYALIDLSILTNSINTTTSFEKDFDPTIPEIIIDPNGFVKILNKSYQSFEGSSSITTKIFYRVGEYIKLEDKKYTLLSIEIHGDVRHEDRLEELKAATTTGGFFVDIQKKVVINLPIVKSLE